MWSILLDACLELCVLSSCSSYIKAYFFLHFGLGTIKASNCFCEKDDYYCDTVPSGTLLSLQEMHLQEAVQWRNGTLSNLQYWLRLCSFRETEVILSSSSCSFLSSVNAKGCLSTPLTYKFLYVYLAIGYMSGYTCCLHTYSLTQDCSMFNLRTMWHFHHSWGLLPSTSFTFLLYALHLQETGMPAFCWHLVFSWAVFYKFCCSWI